MDEKDKKIADLTAELTKANATIATLNGTVAEKDKEIVTQKGIIDQKNTDIKNLTRKNTELKELTEEEKKSMSEREIQLHEANLALQKEQEQFRQEQADARKRDIAEKRKGVFDKIIDGTKHPEARKKLEEKFEAFNGAAEAETAEDIERFANEAFGALSVSMPDVSSMRTAVNSQGGAPNIPAGGDEKAGDGFADSDRGKEAAAALGLTFAQGGQDQGQQ